MSQPSFIYDAAIVSDNNGLLCLEVPENAFGPDEKPLASKLESVKVSVEGSALRIVRSTDGRLLVRPAHLRVATSGGPQLSKARFWISIHQEAKALGLNDGDEMRVQVIDSNMIVTRV